MGLVLARGGVYTPPPPLKQTHFLKLSTYIAGSSIRAPSSLPEVTRAAIQTGLTKLVLSGALSLGTAHETWWPGKQGCPIPSSLDCHLLLRATI